MPQKIKISKLVTTAQYAKFLEVTSRTEVPAPPMWETQRKYKRVPVTYVSWTDANAYATWAGGRLITEAEWIENKYKLDGLGLYEWADMGYDADNQRVVRGGAFYDDPRLVRCAYRDWGRPDDRYIGVGFRVVRA